MVINKNIKIAFFSLLILGMFLLIASIFLERMNYFKVKQIIVNQNIVSKHQREAILLEDQDKDLYEININKIKSTVQSIYSNKAVQITKKYPDTLIIDILQNDLIAFLKVLGPAKHSSNTFGLNANGNIISSYSYYNDKANQQLSLLTRGYPLIKSYLPTLFKVSRSNYLKIGTKIKNEQVLSILKSLSLIKKLDDRFFKQIISISIYQKHNRNYLVLNDLKTRFYFGRELSLIQLMKIDSLEEDLSTKVTLRKIDLRFDDILGKN